MATPHVEGLISNLHRKFAGSDTSPQQEALLRELQSRLVDWEGPKNSGPDPLVTAETLAAELEAEHPQLAGIVRELIVELGRIGI